MLGWNFIQTSNMFPIYGTLFEATGEIYSFVKSLIFGHISLYSDTGSLICYELTQVVTLLKIPVSPAILTNVHRIRAILRVPLAADTNISGLNLINGGG